jgi:hypothetical protein
MPHSSKKIVTGPIDTLITNVCTCGRMFFGNPSKVKLQKRLHQKMCDKGMTGDDLTARDMMNECPELFPASPDVIKKVVKSK